jgi:glycolate oxidase iron-sulfur subunit
METDSPRGRIALIDAMTSGRAAPTAPLLAHLDACLQCRACESACPSAVPFGRIMEDARGRVVESAQAPLAWKLRTRALRELLPHRSRMSVVAGLGRAYQRSRTGRAVRAAVRRLLPPVARIEEALPRLSPEPFRMPAQPPGLTRTLALLTGCVMPHMYPRTHEATVRVLNRLGYRVVAPEQQTCCGALSLHAGDRRTARDLARRNVDAFLASGAEAVIVNAAGCGSTMKEYADILTDDPSCATAARQLSARTYDVLEFVASHALPPLGRVDATVTLQDSCHLAHAQGITEAPRALLRAIPGVELREMAAPDRCCGSAGIYSLVQRDLSTRLLRSKMDDVARTGASVIATANPGCMAQLEAGTRGRALSVRVVHVIELLDEAMQRAD